VPTDPADIFDWIARDVPLYSGLNYDNIGLLGTAPLPAPQEVTQ
jgi:hypothetical protein